MPSIEIKHLLNYNRLSDSTGDLFTLLIYSPLGSVLFLVRLSLLLVAYLLSIILPKVAYVQHFLHRLLTIVFGIVVQVDNPDKCEDVETYISNKVSSFDATVINFLTNSISPGLKFNPLISSILGFKDFGSTTNIEDLRKSIEKVLGGSKIPLLFQPESSATNGKGLLKFNISPFILYSKVQPITITVHRPVLNAAISTISSDYWRDVFWYMFVPCTVYKIKFLPAVEKKSVSDGEFCDRIRQNIGNDLNIELTNFVANELKEFKKRHHIELQRANLVQRPFSTPTVNPELHQMTLQVREVLPLVPYNVVYKDLAKTRSVDITITNILEGIVEYTPEQPKQSTSITSNNKMTEPSSSTSGNSSCSSLSRTPLNTAAAVFAKSPQERTLSFQERKKLLIENARRKYIEKHGLNIVGS
nr:ancient ubiquitous protein 1-like [Onthophagus taurus]